MVVVDVGSAPATAPWLQETTYLIDSSAHTTAVIAQTNKPTSGVALQPKPFTPANAQVQVPQTPAPTSPTAPTTRPLSQAQAASHGRPAIFIAGAVVGALIGVLIAALTFYFFKRRRRRIRLQAGGLFPDEKSGSPSSSSSPNTLVGSPETSRTRVKWAKALEWTRIKDRKNGHDAYGEHDGMPRKALGVAGLGSDTSSTLTTPATPYGARAARDLSMIPAPAGIHAKPVSILKRSAAVGDADVARPKEETTEPESELGDDKVGPAVSKGPKVRFGVDQIKYFAGGPVADSEVGWSEA